MRNFMKEADVVTATAPAGGVASGAGVVVGDMFGVATTTAAAGAQVELVVEGQVSLPKAALAISEGVRVFWDDTAKNVTTTATGNRCIGFAIGPGNYASGATQISVKLTQPNATGA